MKQWATVVALVGMLLLPALVAAQEWVELPENPLEGRTVFLDKGCGRCHAIWGEGGKIGPDLGKAGAGRSILELAGMLWNHAPEMLEKMLERTLSRPVFTRQEMASLMGFLLYLNYLDEPGDAAVGARLFRDKACVRCHAVGGQGGSVGPPLDRYQRYGSALFMAQAMWNHGPQMEATIQTLGVPRPTFAEQEMVHLLSYIRQTASGVPEARVYLQPGSPERGKRLFAANGCLGCHAIRGEGGNVGPDLGYRPLRRSLTEVAGLMWNHAPHMRQRTLQSGTPLPTFVDQEMADVIAYLYFVALQGQPGDARRGGQVSVRLRCGACHTGEKAGENLAPALAQSLVVRDPVALATAMWNHGAIMQQWVRERHLPWPLFVGNDMADLQQYLVTSPASAP